MNTNIDWDLFARHLSGECTSEDDERIRQWIDLSPANAAAYDSMKRLWSLTAPEMDSAKLDAMWTALAKKAGIALPGGAVGENARKSAHRFRNYLRVAASFAAAILIPYVLFMLFSGAPNEGGGRDMQHMAVANGATEELILPDGSTVILDAGSEFQYPAAFGKDRREVHVKGAAYFAVAPEPERPFLVRARHAAVEVLGTEFSVSAWESEGSVSVVVINGRVSLRSGAGGSPTGGMMVTNGQMAAIDGKGRISPPRAVDVAKHISWMKHEMEYRGAPFGKVLEQVARWHDLQISLSDSSSIGDAVTFYLKDEPVEDIVRTLALMMNMTYRREGRRVTFSPGAP